jgi:hypothetical protein
MIYLGKFDHDRSLLSWSLEIMVYFREIMPESIAELFRLVKYYNLPRFNHEVITRSIGWMARNMSKLIRFDVFWISNDQDMALF